LINSLAARGLIVALNRERPANLIEVEIVGSSIGLDDVQLGASYVLEAEVVSIRIGLEEVCAALQGGSVAGALGSCTLIIAARAVP
jgi:hypothetical protein